MTSPANIPKPIRVERAAALDAISRHDRYGVNRPDYAEAQIHALLAIELQLTRIADAFSTFQETGGTR